MSIIIHITFILVLSFIRLAISNFSSSDTNTSFHSAPVDVKRVGDKFHVFAKGGREDTGIEALSWIKNGVASGAGEVVVNSIDTDGVKQGFDIELLDLVCNAVNVPVIASGGAGSVSHFIDLFKAIPSIDAALAASVFHFGEIEIPDLKKELKKNNIIVRL